MFRPPSALVAHFQLFGDAATPMDLSTRISLLFLIWLVSLLAAYPSRDVKTARPGRKGKSHVSPRSASVKSAGRTLLVLPR